MLVSSASADLTVQDNSKNTALHLACSKVCAHFKAVVIVSISSSIYSFSTSLKWTELGTKPVQWWLESDFLGWSRGTTDVATMVYKSAQ